MLRLVGSRHRDSGVTVSAVTQRALAVGVPPFSCC